MFAHPVVAVVAVLDATSLVAMAVAAATAVQVLLRWAPASSSRAQLVLEARADGASTVARLGLLVLLGASLLLLVAIAEVLPRRVPGAMCGTGVLQAMAGRGQRALALRVLALGALGAWQLIDRLNRDHPRAPLTVTAARALLVALPLVVLGIVETARALWSLDLQTPVDCCAAVYDRVRASPGTASTPWTSTGILTWLTAGVGAVVAGLGLGLRWTGGRVRGSATIAVAVGSVSWVAIAYLATVHRLAAYHYGVLHHHCPWCLFLVEHHGVGFALLGALGMVLSEGPAAWLAGRFAAPRSPVRPAAERRLRQAGLRVALGVAAFGLLVGLPALLWRLRYGAWITG